MTPITEALIWAAAIIVIAVATRTGLIADSLGLFSVLSLPAIAWSSISRNQRVAACQRIGC